MNRGFSIIEIMIAMVIIITVISAIFINETGNQNMLISGQTNSEALNIAKSALADAEYLARKDFRLVNPKQKTYDGYYTSYTTIEPAPFLDDYFSKLIKSKVSWTDAGNTSKEIELSTIISNFNNPTSEDTCQSYISGDWTSPEIKGVFLFKDSITPVGEYMLSDVDAYKNILYLTASKTTNPTDPTLFIFDVKDKKNPKLLGEADNAEKITSGLNAIYVAEDLNVKKLYAYIASNSASNYTTCDASNDSGCGQLDIFDVTDPANLKKINLKIESSPAISGQSTGSSVLYKDGYIFLGLEKTDGPEFHIIDAHNPSNITSGSLSSLGGLEIGHGINSINVRNNYAYLAAVNNISSDQELKIIDISNPKIPYQGPEGNPYGFNSEKGGGNGKSMYLVGDNLYLGKTAGASYDLYILDNTSPSSVLLPLGGLDIGSKNSIDKIIVRDYLSFLLTNNDLEIYNTSDPANIIPWGSITLPGSYKSSYPNPSMDCEGNNIFITSNNEGGQGALYVIGPK